MSINNCFVVVSKIIISQVPIANLEPFTGSVFHQL